MIVLALILCGVVWHGVRIEELYKNYRWMYDKQCELIYTTNHFSSTIAKLCSTAIKNGDGLEYWAFDPNSRNKRNTSWRCVKCNSGYYKYFDMYEGEGKERVLLFECPTCKRIWAYTYWWNEPMCNFINPYHPDTGGRHLWNCCGEPLIHAEGVKIIGKHDCFGTAHKDKPG